MSPVLFFPATCELCGHWIPQHAANCPRNGVHPSQWSSSLSLTDLALDNQVTNYHPALNQNYLKLRQTGSFDLACGSGPVYYHLDATHITLD